MKTISITIHPPKMRNPLVRSFETQFAHKVMKSKKAYDRKAKIYD